MTDYFDKVADLLEGAKHKAAFGHVKRILHIEAHSDEDVMASVKFLSLSNTECPEDVARIFSVGRGSDIVQEVRKQSAQKLIDAGCKTELAGLVQAIDASFAEVEACTADSSVDAKLVGVSFQYTKLARITSRMRVLEQKSSEEFLR